MNDLIGFSTFALALVTAFLAWRTSRLASETERMAEATRESVEVSRLLQETSQEQLEASRHQTLVSEQTFRASIQPLLADVPAGVYTDGEVVRVKGYANPISIVDRADIVTPEPTSEFVSCSAPLRNIGPGVAVVTGAGVVEAGDTRWVVELTRTIVAPGELLRVTASVPTDREELEPLRRAISQGSWLVEVRYGNVKGSESFITRLNVSGTQVRQVNFFRPGEEKPFLTSAPADG